MVKKIQTKIERPKKISPINTKLAAKRAFGTVDVDFASVEDEEDLNSLIAFERGCNYGNYGAEYE